MISADAPLCAPGMSWMPCDACMQPCDACMMTAVLGLQIICTHLQSYGLVSMPAGLPASLETLCVGTKARGRRIGPSLLMPEAPQLSNVKVGLLATDHLRHCTPSTYQQMKQQLRKNELPTLRCEPLSQTNHNVDRSSHSALTDD